MNLVENEAYFVIACLCITLAIFMHFWLNFGSIHVHVYYGLTLGQHLYMSIHALLELLCTQNM